MKKSLNFAGLLLICFQLIEKSFELNTKKTLLISFDGLRADKLDSWIAENETSNFRFIADRGLKADYMIPVFPSLTFTNHWSIITGVYSETHGIVSNIVYDPLYNRRVNLITEDFGNDPQWWNTSEPLWLTARKNGLKTAASFWVGSGVWTRNPDIWLPYSKSYTYTTRIDELINWISKFDIDFSTLYFPEPDSTGHLFGPDSENYRDKIKEMDGVLGYLLQGLKDRQLIDKLNIIIVSDHGMGNARGAPILVQNYSNLDLIDTNKSVFDFVSSVYPKQDSQLTALYESLSKLPNSKVFYKKDVPVEYHYTNSNRIGPIVVVSDEGYVLSLDPNYRGSIGVHGYNNSLPTMRAIFLAMGPSFKPGSKMQGFPNINVHPLICKLLDIKSDQSQGNSLQFEPFINSASVNFKPIKLSVFLLIVFYLAYYGSFK